jgi:hypothetical protein
VLEQVAGGQDGIHPRLLGELEDAGQHVATVPPPEPRRLWTRPGERGVQVQVCEVEEPHVGGKVSRCVATARASRTRLKERFPGAPTGRAQAGGRSLMT